MTCNTVHSSSEVVVNEAERNTFHQHSLEECFLEENLFQFVKNFEKQNEGNNYKIFYK